MNLSISKESDFFNCPDIMKAAVSRSNAGWKNGIDKHISWHCARHSFAVNILNNGANIKTFTNLLGHSGLKHTEKYTHAVDELKEPIAQYIVSQS